MMTLFPEIVVSILIIGALVWTALGGVLLLVLLYRDFKNKTIW